MSYIEFEPKYRTYTIMDREHKQLISIINRFFDEWVGNKEIKPLPYLLELADYGQNHFDSEERFMENNHSHNIEEHKAIHKKLMERLVEMIQRVQNGEEITMETFQFLQHWLMNHISGTDRASYGVLGNKTHE